MSNMTTKIRDDQARDIEIHKRDPKYPGHAMCCVVVDGSGPQSYRVTVNWDAVTCEACLSWKDPWA